MVRYVDCFSVSELIRISYMTLKQSLNFRSITDRNKHKTFLPSSFVIISVQSVLQII